MKSIRIRIISIFVAAVMLLSVIPVSAESGSSEKPDYPYVFVHGMMGWGFNDGFNTAAPYWGFSTGRDYVKELNDSGKTVYAASIGPISSAWDRACELYAELTGTVVDYGEAHSAQNGHERYGRSYEGNALMPNFGKTDETGNQVKINLLGHSFGGATVRLFAYILANGCEEELNASGNDASDFFKGGHADWIYSITTFSSPNNGAITADFLYEYTVTAAALALFANVLGISSKSSFWDYRLEAWGLTSVPEQGIKGSFNFKRILDFANSHDNCGYDLSVDGTEELNSKIDTVDSIYYFCYSAKSTKTTVFGTEVPNSAMHPMFYLSALQVGACAGKDYGQSYEFTKEWQPNDGIVSVKSAQNPVDEKGTPYDDSITDFETGIWYIMPVLENVSHVSYMGMGYPEFDKIFDNYFHVIESI